MKKNKKKIAIISSSFPPYGIGGVTTSHFNLYQALKKKYSNIKVLTFCDLGKSKKSTSNIVRFGSPKIYMDFIHLLSRVFFGITSSGRCRGAFLHASPEVPQRSDRLDNQHCSAHCGSLFLLPERQSAAPAEPVDRA